MEPSWTLVVFVGIACYYAGFFTLALLAMARDPDEDRRDMRARLEQ